MSSAICSPAADSAFGPAVEGCRQGFDFTLAFESYIFSIVPSVLLLCFAPLRFKSLSRVRPKIKGTAFKYVKLVSWISISHTRPAAHKVYHLVGHRSTRYLPIDVDRTYCQQPTIASMETSNGGCCSIFWLQYRSPHPLVYGAFEISPPLHVT
jgi:hypothetical protein